MYRFIFSLQLNYRTFLRRHSMSSDITLTRTEGLWVFLSTVIHWILTLYRFINIWQTWLTRAEAGEKNRCGSLLLWAIAASLEVTCFANSILGQCRKLEALRYCPEWTCNCRRFFWLIIAAPSWDQNQSYRLN